MQTKETNWLKRAQESADDIGTLLETHNISNRQELETKTVVKEVYNTFLIHAQVGGVYASLMTQEQKENNPTVSWDLLDQLWDTKNSTFNALGGNDLADIVFEGILPMRVT